MHFQWPSAIFQGEGKTHRKITILSNVNCWYLMFVYYYIDEIIQLLKKNICPPPHSELPGCENCYIHHRKKNLNENYVAFDLRRVTVLVICFQFYESITIYQHWKEYLLNLNPHTKACSSKTILTLFLKLTDIVPSNITVTNLQFKKSKKIVEFGDEFELSSQLHYLGFLNFHGFGTLIEFKNKAVNYY